MLQVKPSCLVQDHLSVETPQQQRWCQGIYSCLLCSVCERLRRREITLLLSSFYKLDFTLIWLSCSDACWHPRWYPLPLSLPLTDTWAATIKKSISRVMQASTFITIKPCLSFVSFLVMSYRKDARPGGKLSQCMSQDLQWRKTTWKYF